MRIRPASSGLSFASVSQADPAFLVKVPSGGIPGRSGLATGSASCDLFQLDDSGTIDPVRKPNGQGVRIIARNPSAQRIRGPVSNYEGDQYLSVTYDGNRSWIIDPPKQTLLCKPVSRLKAKSWGWLANCDMPTESGHRSESRSRSTTFVTMHF